jgi:cell fate regulator YaaT (PSP1 superfamily)
MPMVCGVRFRGAGKVYHFSPGDEQDLQMDDNVVVETSRGVELGRVAVAQHEVPVDEVVGELKPIVRRATHADLLDAELYQSREAEVAETCRAHVLRMGLPMKVVGAEYSFDGSRLTFFFTSEQRVDFRDLVRELARSFHTRIELRQIGVRDEARLVGGLGRCGRSLCCSTWLNEFCPVSIRMAKQQDLPLSPMEISGLCGRLLCCLGYEDEFYKEVKGRFPKVGKRVSTPLGQGKVVRVSALRELVTILYDDGNTVEMTAEQLAGTEPITPPAEARNNLSEAQRSALDGALVVDSPSTPPSPAHASHVHAPRERRPVDAASGPDTEGGEPDDERTPRRRSRPRRKRGPSRGPDTDTASSKPAAGAADDRHNGQRPTGEGAQRPRRTGSRRSQQSPPLDGPGGSGEEKVRQPAPASRSAGERPNAGDQSGAEGSSSGSEATGPSRRRRRGRRSRGSRSSAPDQGASDGGASSDG